jgi:beta-lactamase class A
MAREGANLAEVFAAAGCRGSVHATTLDGGLEVGLDADEVVAPASVIKVLVALAAETQMADGRLDPAERVRIAEPSGVPGPVGMSLFQDAVEVSVRDLVVPMLTISDNVATDALLERVGLDEVNGTAGRLGLDHTHLGSTIRELVDSVAADAGFADWAGFVAWHRTGPSPDELRSVQRRFAAAGALRPGSPTRTSPRDMTRLLRAIWSDTAGPAPACARVRDLMARQLTRHRLAGGFGPGVTVAAKSGALLGVVRNEVGVVSFPDEPPYVLAVFTRSAGPDVDERPVNRAIGRAAELAVAELRSAAR